jgi:hypothetical protein
MGKATCKNPAGEPTRKQTWAIFCMTGEDMRKCKLTRQEVSNMIGDLKSKGDHTLPSGKKYTDKHGDESDFICTKAALKETANGLWEKSGKSNPMTVGAVVKSKKVPGNGSKPYDQSRWAVDLLAEAVAKGEESLKILIDSHKVVPMVVQQHADIFNDNSPVTEQWVVEGGACGFASIRVKCTNKASRKFISQLKKSGIAGGRNDFKEWSKSDYYGGYMKSFTRIGGQSLAYKTAYAYGFESVLAKAGIDTWVWTRMD